MIPSYLSGPSASDKLADEAEELARELQEFRGYRYDAPCLEAVRLSQWAAGLLTAAAMLRRTPVAQQRLVRHLLDQRRDEFRGLRQDYDA